MASLWERRKSRTETSESNRDSRRSHDGLCRRLSHQRVSGESPGIIQRYKLPSIRPPLGGTPRHRSGIRLERDIDQQLPGGHAYRTHRSLVAQHGKHTRPIQLTLCGCRSYGHRKTIRTAPNQICKDRISAQARYKFAGIALPYSDQRHCRLEESKLALHSACLNHTH